VNTSGRAPIQPDLRDAIRALMLLRAEMEQREKRLHAGISQQMQSLREDLLHMHQRVAQVMNTAGEKIGQEARQAMGPVTVEYERKVAAASTRLHAASGTVRVWTAIAGGVLLLVLLIAWAVMGYYRRELASAKDELARYENAVPIVQAFYASDAVVCDGRICANVDPNAGRLGDKRQYRPAKPRSR
jgi:hypothetical protein